MSSIYVDTSALARVLMDEVDKPAILAELDRHEQRLASRLLRIELRRVALRKGLLEFVERLLASLALVPLDEATFTSAETVRPATVATLDAIHLATIVRLADASELDAVMTYDRELAAAVQAHGIPVLAPG